MQCAFPLLVLAIAYPLIGLNAESAERVLLFYVASWPVSAYNFSPFRLFGLPSSTLSDKWSEKRPLPFVYSFEFPSNQATPHSVDSGIVAEFGSVGIGARI